jgi:hypothetical protein
MERLKRLRVPIVILGAGIGILPTIPAVFLAIASGGAGHGGYLFAWLFYPLELILVGLFGDGSVTCVEVLALAQFSIYGGILAYCATVSKRATMIASLILAAFHVLPIVLMILLSLT